jgi:hypothetical protein
MNSSITFLAISISLLGLVIWLPRKINASRKKTLLLASGKTQIVGEAGKSLQSKGFRIREENRRKGLIGEIGVAEDLEALAVQYGLTVLHDLSMPDSDANIDHILISKKVVYVIDAKNYSGIVKIVPNKLGEKRLRVGKTDQTKLADKLRTYSDAISNHLEREGLKVKVLPLLAFYQATFHDDSAVTINGVTVNVFGIENELLRYANIKSQEIDVETVANLILAKFPPKTV